MSIPILEMRQLRLRKMDSPTPGLSLTPSLDPCHYRRKGLRTPCTVLPLQPHAAAKGWLPTNPT